MQFLPTAQPIDAKPKQMPITKIALFNAFSS